MTKSKQLLVSKHKEQEQEHIIHKQEKKQKHLPLEINLDEIKSPHPKLVEAYKDTGDQYYPFDQNPECLNERRIWLYANASKPPTPIKHKIVSLYRKKEGEKEYCFFNEHLMTSDLFQNPLDHTRTVGKYQLPNIVNIVGMDPNADFDHSHPKELGSSVLSSQIDHVDTIYEFEFEKIKPQLQEWRSKGIIDENTQYIAWVGTKKYTVNSWDEFINLRIQDLVLLGRVGFDATGLFDSRNKDMIADILAIAKEKGKEQLVKRLQS